MEVTVNYRGSVLVLEGDYVDAHFGGYEDESHSEYFELYQVIAGDVVITDILSDTVIEELELLALETLS